MRGDLLDLVLLGAMALFAVSGYRQGFLMGVLSFGGFLAGGVLGTFLAPVVVGRLDAGASRAAAGIVIVLVAASLGQLAGAYVGARLRQRVTWGGARKADSVGGAVVAAAGVLLVAWLLGTAVTQTPYAGLSRQVRRSAVLAAVDRVLPPAPTVFAAFRQLIGDNGFPQVFANLGPTDSVPVDPPDPRVLGSRAVRLARSRVVKVTGSAPSCSTNLEGTGFVYARNRVMTNAHVVAGVREPQVQAEGGPKMSARLVLYDPARDVAVLFVPELRLPPLEFAASAERGDSALVVGYPQGQPFSAVAARVREQITAVGRDIYQRGTVRRRVYSLRARIRPGHSGGPLLAPDGRVYGLVFAAAADDDETGYALTAAEVAADAEAGAARTELVSSRACA